MILTPDQPQPTNSEFRLSPSFEWEVGMVDIYIECITASVKEDMNTHENYWFQYIYEVGGDDIASYLTSMQKINYSSHQRY